MQKKILLTFILLFAIAGQNVAALDMPDYYNFSNSTYMEWASCSNETMYGDFFTTVAGLINDKLPAGIGFALLWFTLLGIVGISTEGYQMPLIITLMVLPVLTILSHFGFFIPQEALMTTLVIMALASAGIFIGLFKLFKK